MKFHIMSSDSPEPLGDIPTQAQGESWEYRYTDLTDRREVELLAWNMSEHYPGVRVFRESKSGLSRLILDKRRPQ